MGGYYVTMFLPLKTQPSLEDILVLLDGLLELALFEKVVGLSVAVCPIPETRLRQGGEESSDQKRERKKQRFSLKLDQGE